MPTDDVAVALNTAFMGDGAVIRVAAGATSTRPIHLRVRRIPATRPAAVFTALAGRDRRAARAPMLVESHEGAAGRDYQVNAALELMVGDEAHVDHVKITGEGAERLHVRR